MKKIKMLVAVIGMMVAILTTFLNADTPTSSGGGGGEFPDGCTSCEGYSTTTGQPCNSGCGCGPLALPDKLPIGDVVDLQAYAWEQVSQIGMSGWASSAINMNEKSSVWFPYAKDNGVDIDEVFWIIKAQQLFLSVLYPSDRIEFQAGLFDGYGNNLLYSYSSAGINPPQNGVSENILDVVFNMNSEIWIPFGGAQWFRIVERDEKGNPVRYYHSSESDVQNGGIWFSAYYAKKGGEIIISLCDGTEVAYSLNGGKKIIPTTVQIGIGNVSALGMRTFRDTMIIRVTVSFEESERNINPLSQFVNTSRGEVSLSAWRTISNPKEGEVWNTELATGVKIWRQGQPSSTAQRFELNSPNYTSIVRLDKGRYWLKFEFSSGWPHGNQFQPPYQYGGN